ncbi:OmpA family protein [Candidatus Puniceispirillum sp.]|nr:OmpA family protein [Alphaproteobacteria bacterium]MDC1294003.1 OmpA family protein [Candidatus Puniceispirillum sp.]
MKICRTLRAVFIGLWLSGCSVVVFEDGPACPANRACPVVEMPPAAPADVAPAKAENAVPAKTPDQALDQAPTEAATKQDKIDIKIDGYLSYFDYDSAVLSQQTLSGILFVADYLKSNPAVQILIEGHCDERGTRDYNIALGHKRAEAVRKQLARMGVDPQRITTKSFGKERPAMRGASPEAWAKNRRTIIRIRGE